MSGFHNPVKVRFGAGSFAGLAELVKGRRAVLLGSAGIAKRGTLAAVKQAIGSSLVGTFTIPAIPAGGSVTRTWSTCPIGTLLATADRAGTVTESNEGDNTRTLVTTSC